jgi:DNA-binding Lrp family transcriptional regulator
MVEISRIKLDKADRTILAELDKNCRVPTSRLAKLARKSRQSVEYRIKNLVSRGVITSFNVAFNPHRMGRRIFKLYFRLKNIPHERKKFFEHLRNCGTIYWVGECDGRWDVVFGFFTTKTEYEFYELKNEVITKFGHIILESYGDALLDVKQYPKMYFTGEVAKPAMFGGDVVHNKMDGIDHEILARIVNNARIPLSQLAAEVKSTPATVANRLRRMEKLGIIIQYRIGVNLDVLGVEQYKAIIHIERYDKQDEKRLLEYISSLPNTQYFIRNIWNIEPEFVVDNYHEYWRIIDRLRQEFPDTIKEIETVFMKTDEWTPGLRNMFEGRAQPQA